MRKALYILTIFLSCALITVCMSIGFLHSTLVQTGLIRLATDQLSVALNTHAEVQQISYRFPAKLEVDGVYLEDQEGDTLAYVGRLYAHFSPRALLRDTQVVFHTIEVEHVRAYARTLASGRYNYQWLVDAFASENEEKTDTEFPFRGIQLPNIQLKDIALRMDEQELSVEEIDIRIPYVVTSLDSIRANVQISKGRYLDLCVNEMDADLILSDSLLQGTFMLDSKDLKMHGMVKGQNPHGDFRTENLQEMGIQYELDIDDVTLKLNEVQDFVSKLQKRPFHFAKEVMRLGEMHYTGKVSGDLQSAKLKGVFRSQLGKVQTDARIRGSKDYQAIDFDGKLYTPYFRLGRMLGNSKVGRIRASLNCGVHFEAGRYPTGDVEFEIADKQQEMQLTGRLDWNDEMPEFSAEFIAGHVSLSDYGITGKYEDMTIGTSIYADLTGHNLNDLNGYLFIDSTTIYRPSIEDTLHTSGLKIELTAEPNLDGKENANYKRFLLTSDLLTGRIEGEFEYETLPTTMMKLAVKNVPGLFTSKKAREILSRESKNKLDMYLYGRELCPLQYNLGLPIWIGDYPVVKAFIDEEKGLWGLQGYVQDVISPTRTVRDVTLSAGNYDGAGHIDVSALLEGGLYTLRTLMEGDSIRLDLLAKGDSAIVEGGIHTLTHIKQHKGMPRLEMRIDESEIVFNDSMYHFSPAEIRYTVSDTMLEVKHLSIGTRSQYLEADGIISRHEQDKMSIQLSQIDAGNILKYILSEETLTVQGQLTGTANLYGILSKPMFEADLLLKNAGLNGAPFGDAHTTVRLSENRDAIEIGAFFTEESGDSIPRTDTVAVVTGGVDLVSGDGSWGIDIDANGLPLGFIEHWTSSFLTNYGGKIFGRVSVMGREGDVFVLAQVKPEDGHITVPFTGCTYYLNDSCFLDSTHIYFPNLTLKDEEGNDVRLNGVLEHKSFQDFRFGIDIAMDHALVVNRPDKGGDLLQGKVYAGGKVRIEGDDQLVKLTADAHTEKQSRLRVSLEGSGEAASSNFVTFVGHGDVEPTKHKSLKIRPKRVEPTKLQSKFELGLNVEANRNLLFQLVLNDKTGDMIEAYGDGALRITYEDQSEKTTIAGTYELEGGTLGFTLAGAFRRNFAIAEGSQIIFSGRPEDPELNVTAKYHTTANLRDLFGTEASSITNSRTSIPVNTLVTLTGRLSNPIIRFGIELPSSDEAVRNQVMSVVNTDEMLMRQVVYLVAFGRFYTPEYMASENSVRGVNESFSLLSSTITGQINSWLSKLTDRVTLGVNIRSENGFGSESSQEYEAQFQIQPISRILINGNIGYRYSQISNQPIFGDLDVEFLLTENGKFRLKGFTHMVDKYSLRQSNASTIQGIGFVFKHDFNGRRRREEEMTSQTWTVSDLQKAKKKKQKKQDINTQKR